MNVIGKIATHGCDVVKIISIIINGFVNAKIIQPNNKSKIVKIHIDDIEFI